MAQPVNVQGMKVHKPTMTKEEGKKYLVRMRAEDKEMVKGIFHFHECPGGTLAFPYRAYLGDEIEVFNLTDGQVYSLPKGVAKHLNKNCWYPKYDYVKGEPGTQGAFNNMTGVSMKITNKVRRCSFQSLDFVDIDDITPVGKPLSEVELLS